MRFSITGGIGSGKSYVCKLLKEKGIDIYDCDKGAKRLIRNEEAIKRQLTDLIGPNTYVDGKYNTAAVTKFLLASEQNKRAINAIVHPAVIRDFYDSGLQWMECAILYEAHLEQYVDKVIAVTAPREVRIQRVMARDGISRDKATQWVDSQMSQDIIAQRADFVIVNDGKEDLYEQINRIIV